MGFTVAFLNMPCLYLSALLLPSLMVLASYYWPPLSLQELLFCFHVICIHTMLGSEDNLKCPSSAAVHLSLRGPYWPGTHHVGQGAWLSVAIDLPVSASPDLGLHAHANTLSLENLGSGRADSSPNVCTASTLLAELSHRTSPWSAS